MDNDKIEKIITMIKRDRNYGANDFKGFESSLRHSLRLKQNEYDEFEIDEKLSYLNRIFFNGKTEQLTPENASTILEKMLEDFNRDVEETKSTKSNEKERNLYRQTKKKLKDYSNEIDIEEISKYIDDVMEVKKEFNREEYNRILTRNNQKRINQKLDLLESFTELNDKLSGNEKVKKHTNRIKETILVIPSTNEIGDPIGYGDFVRNTIIDFYNKNFPEFEIKFAVSHLDETTPHAHLFLDLKNKFTNKYDYNNKEIELIERFIKDNTILNLPRKPELEDYKIPNRKEKRQKYLFDKDLKSWKSSILQSFFFQHFNECALKYEKPVFAQKLPKTDESRKRNKLIEEDAKKPKGERSYNYYQKKIDDFKKEIVNLKKELNTKEKENLNLQKQNAALEEKNVALEEKYQKGLTATKDLHATYTKRKEQLNDIDKSIKEKNNALEIKAENFNKEVDRICDIIEKDNEQIIEKVNNRLSQYEKIYAKFATDIAEFKNSITKAMGEAFTIFGKLKDITLAFDKKKGDKKNGIFNGLQSFIHFGTEKNTEEANKIYKEATKSFDEDYGIGTLLIVDEVVKNNKELQEIKEIKPAFDNTIKPVITKKLDELEYLQSKSRTYKNDLNEVRNEIKQEIKIDRNKYKFKI